MTSNLGADLIKKSTEIGFSAKEGMPEYSVIREKIEQAMRKHFKPEFLNRLSDFVIFKPLDIQALSTIVDTEINKLQQRLGEQRVTLSISAAAKEWLVKKGHQPEMGARPLRRALEQYVEIS